MPQVILSDYQAEWPNHFCQAAAEIAASLSPASARLEHIGSTAIPGLCAKPVIDILLGVVALSDVESRLDEIRQLGYVYRPEYETELPERRYFVRAPGATPRVHLHAVVAGSQTWARHLAFREALRADAALSGQYARLKHELAATHANDKAAYTEAKGPFIERVLANRQRAGPHSPL